MPQSIFKLLKKGGARRERIKTQLDARKSKSEARKLKSKNARLSRSRALPRRALISLPNNYVNPITLNGFQRGAKIYQLKNRQTGRLNYYNRPTLFKLLPSSIKNNYNLLLAFPKRPLFRNPTTRSNVFPRNLTLVEIK